MKMKTYRDKTFRGALDQIKGEWGSEAFVLSSRRVRDAGVGGLVGRRVFEVTAGVEDGSGATRQDSPPTPPPASVAREYASAMQHLAEEPALRARAMPPPAPPKPDTPTARESREMVELRRWIYSLTRLALPPSVFMLGEAVGEIYEELCANDVDPTIAKSLINTAHTYYPAAGKEKLGEMHAYVGSLIEKMVPVKITSKKIKAFVGPTGVGKTTTVAKLGARALVNREGKIGLVTLDTFRIGGIQQLRTYAEIMSAPMKVARSVAELQRVLQEWQHFDLVFIDTVGKNQRRLEDMTELAAFLKGRSDIEKHLLLSATTKAPDLLEIVEKFEMFSPDFLAFTKLDETTTYGCLLNEPHRAGKPLSYFGVGQRVPEDLEVAEKRRVSELIIGGGM